VLSAWRMSRGTDTVRRGASAALKTPVAVRWSVECCAKLHWLHEREPAIASHIHPHQTAQTDISNVDLPPQWCMSYHSTCFWHIGEGRGEWSSSVQESINVDRIYISATDFVPYYISLVRRAQLWSWRLDCTVVKSQTMSGRQIGWQIYHILDIKAHLRGYWDTWHLQGLMVDFVIFKLRLESHYESLADNFEQVAETYSVLRSTQPPTVSGTGNE